MFKKITNACVTLVQRFLPDPFIFCIILTILCFLLAMPLTSQGASCYGDALGQRGMGTVDFLHADGPGFGAWFRHGEFTAYEKIS